MREKPVVNKIYNVSRYGYQFRYILSFDNKMISYINIWDNSKYLEYRIVTELYKNSDMYPERSTYTSGAVEVDYKTVISVIFDAGLRRPKG